jgi:branched-chain amino acid transport system ATP-binding protein
VLLELIKLNKFFGGLHVLSGISFGVDGGEIYSIIGSNGAGKSTILKTLSGLIKPSSGRIDFDGRRVDGSGADVIVDRGISLVPFGPGTDRHPGG